MRRTDEKTRQRKKKSAYRTFCPSAAWVFFSSFTVNSIGIKSMSVAHNKFSLWHFFSRPPPPLPFFLIYVFFVSAFFSLLSSFHSTARFSCSIFIFEPRFSAKFCMYCCYRVAFQCKCLICVSTYELASFFPSPLTGTFPLRRRKNKYILYI